MVVRNQPSSHHGGDEKPGPMTAMVNGLLTFGYYLMLPVFLLVLLDWVAYWLLKDTFYQDGWVMPVLVLASAFLAGAFMRQKAADDRAGMGSYALAMIALCVFAYLTWLDINTSGGVYSLYLPQIMKNDVMNFIYLLPGVGLVGMLFYRHLSLKRYD